MVTAKQAERWACDLASTLLESDLSNSAWGLNENDAEHKVYLHAVHRLIIELRDRAGEDVKWPERLSLGEREVRSD